MDTEGKPSYRATVYCLRYYYLLMLRPDSFCFCAFYFNYSNPIPFMHKNLSKKFAVYMINLKKIINNSLCQLDINVGAYIDIYWR